MIVIGGSYTVGLASKVADMVGCAFDATEIKKFPDGEIYVRVDSELDGVDVLFIQSAPDNNAIIESILILDALRDLGAKRINAVFPYLAYMRQDKRFKAGEALSAKTILSLLNDKTDELTLVNAHFLDNGGAHVYHGVSINNLDALPALARYFADRLDNPVFIAPDKGAMRAVKEAASKQDCDFDYLEKNRLNGEEVNIKPKDLKIEGRNVVLLDDMISTGGTMIKASEALRRQGADSINLGCVHGVFSRGAKAFDEVCDSIVCSDTIKRKESMISVADLIAQHVM